MTSIPTITWQILYAGKDVTGNLIPHGYHIDYRESIGGKASTLQISVEDASAIFQNNPPTAGAAVNLSIGYDGNLVSCGNFEVDEWHFQGPPDAFLLKALQAGITRALRTPRSLAYENQSLVQIATTIAARYGMSVVADVVQPDVIYQRLTQRMETDLAFLNRIANLHDYEFNIRGGQLIFYSRPQLEAVGPVGTITKTMVTKFHMGQQHVGKKSYGSATVTHLNPTTKKLLQAVANDPNAASSDTLHITERVETAQQAGLRASAHLHAANGHQLTGELVLPGTMLFRAGNVLHVSGFGAFDAVKFIVKEAKHLLSRQGYVTTLMLRTTVTGTGAAQIISNEYTGRGT